MGEVNILWFGDIHLGFHHNTDEIKKYLESFAAFCNTYDKTFDMVIVNGDLVLKGGEEVEGKNEYTNFKEKFAFLESNFQKKVIYTKGNHDIKRDLVIGALIQSNDKGVPIYKCIKDAKNYKELTEISVHLLNASLPCNNFIDPIQNCHKKIDIDTSLRSYFLVDESQEILYTVINSSVFSIGYDLNNWNKFIQTLESVDKTMTFNYNEIEGQIYFCDKITTSYNKLEEKYKQFTNIGIAHHPPSWLHWTEQNHAAVESSPLQNLLGILDILIVGHEHVNPQAGSFIGGNTLMLKGLKFLDHDVKQAIIDTGFKTLKIKGTEVTEKSFVYMKSDNKFLRRATASYNLCHLKNNSKFEFKIDVKSDGDIADVKIIKDNSAQLCMADQSKIMPFVEKKFRRSIISTKIEYDFIVCKTDKKEIWFLFFTPSDIFIDVKVNATLIKYLENDYPYQSEFEIDYADVTRFAIVLIEEYYHLIKIYLKKLNFQKRIRSSLIQE